MRLHHLVRQVLAHRFVREARRHVRYGIHSWADCWGRRLVRLCLPVLPRRCRGRVSTCLQVPRTTMKRMKTGLRPRGARYGPRKATMQTRSLAQSLLSPHNFPIFCRARPARVFTRKPRLRTLQIRLLLRVWFKNVVLHNACLPVNNVARPSRTTVRRTPRLMRDTPTLLYGNHQMNQRWCLGDPPTESKNLFQMPDQ